MYSCVLAKAMIAVFFPRKHQEYEQRLLEQYMNSQNTAQTNASNKANSTSRYVIMILWNFLYHDLINRLLRQTVWFTHTNNGQ